MEKQFQITQNNEGTNLYFELYGQFDGAAAWELIKIVHRKSISKDKILIGTDNLKEISDSGKTILDNNLHGDHINKIFFSGSKAYLLVPEGFDIYSPEKKHVCKGNCLNCRCRELKSA